jgi:glycosyltransferase involved in cell wall biosynthesis
LIVQDLSYQLLLDHYGREGAPHFPTISRQRLERLRDRQQGIYAGASALLPMSRWLADHLIRSGVPAERVHPVHPGVNAPLAPGTAIPERRRRAVRRLLFVGRDPHTKGLDLVLAALAGLRRGGFDREVTLTVAGPTGWPYPGDLPPGVRFLGPVPAGRIGPLLDQHDLFVMPSRLEGFGIAFVEALSRGLPCIGRDAFAMPEIIRPGIGGALVRGWGVEELAATIAATLRDDGLYLRCATEALRVRDHYTWGRAAAQIRDVVRATGPDRSIHTGPGGSADGSGGPIHTGPGAGAGW